MMKKVMSLLLSALILFVSMGSGFTAFSQDCPYVDADGYYHRLSVGTDGTTNELTFDTDFTRVVDGVREQMKRRNTQIVITYATSDEKYAYSYGSSPGVNTTQTNNEAALKLKEAILNDVFRKNTLGAQNAGNGDYLLKCINNIDNFASMAYASSADTPLAGSVRYYPFKLTLTVSYLGDNQWDDQLKLFAEQFGSLYLNANMSEYMKVKTIYDFIVRNTDYDTDVYTGKYPSTSSRYKMSHSAYGAVYGKNIVRELTNAAGEIEYHIQPKTIVTGEKIIENFDQGLAVCEGISLLFCYLCNYNGIECHIVDGENRAESGKEPDAHEWNYVYLDDGKGDGYQWYQVDATFAENKSYKNVDINNYDYFLRGYTNNNFTIQNHQQPYDYGLAPLFEPAAYPNGRPQLYTWHDADNCAPSARDYAFAKADISGVDNFSQSVIFKRVTDYGGDIGVITSYIYKNGAVTEKIKVEVDENDNSVIVNNDYEIEGFEYNGYTSVYTPIIAYLVPGENGEELEYSAESIEESEVLVNADGSVGAYPIRIYGAGTSVLSESFKIIPLNMSNDANYIEKNISTTATYRGIELQPEVVEVFDGVHYLEKDKDYDLEYYTESGQRVNAPKEIGKYKIKVVFKGNHKGVLESDFEVEKIRLSNLNDTEIVSLPYIPASIRSSNGITGAHKFLDVTRYKAYGVNLVENQDYTVSSEGSMDFGGTGKIYLTGIESAASRTFGGVQNRRVINYKIGTRYDITTIKNFTIADNSTNYVYDGSAIVPASFNVLDKTLVRGKDYKIVSCENNVNAGTAYVNIEGINGCQGRLRLQYRIVPVSLSKAKVDVTTSNGSVSFKVTYGGKTLVKGTDYSVSSVTSGTTTVYTLSGKGNFNGSSTVNVITSGTAASQTQNNTTPVADNKKTKPAPAAAKPENIIYTRASLTKVKAGKKCMTVTWAKQSGTIHGYFIEYSTSKKFKKASTKTVKGNSKTSLKIKKLKKKKKYYVRVRSFYVSGGKTYCSAWSKVKSVKIK